MRVRNPSRPARATDKLFMTAMIDIVFLLLVFFVMTFRLFTPEGEFNLMMPRGSPRMVVQPVTPPPAITVRLQAGDHGQLAGIKLGERVVHSLDELHAHVREVATDGRGPGRSAGDVEIELDCDYNLRYEHVINALTAVSGYIDRGRIVKLVDKISFAPAGQP